METASDSVAPPLLYEVKNLTLTRYESEILRLAKIHDCKGKQVAANAVKHLDKAQLLIEIDPEMAILRFHCSMEEASSAVIAALGDRQYFHGNQIDWKTHDHCLSIIPFLEVLRISMQGFCSIFTPFVRSEDNYLKIGLNAGEYTLWPDPPLEMKREKNGVVDHFDEEIARLLARDSKNHFHEIVKEIKQNRNELLYASAEDYVSKAEIKPSFPQITRFQVFLLLSIYILIIQSTEKQNFVAQCVRALIKLLKAPKKKTVHSHEKTNKPSGRASSSS